MHLDAHTALHTAELLGRERRALAEADRLARSVRLPVVRAAADREPARRPRGVPARPVPARWLGDGRDRAGANLTEAV